MAVPARGVRPFPAVVLSLVLLLLCLSPIPGWIGSFFPGIAGRARFTPGLVLIDTPIHLPFTIDLVLAAGLFLLGYLFAVVVYAILQGRPLFHEIFLRLGALLSGAFILVLCVGLGGLISWVSQEHLPARVRNAIETLGINGDLFLPTAGYTTLHLHGNIITLVALAIGVVFFMGKIRKQPCMPKAVPLTREQRMTPYQRMLDEQRIQKKVDRAAARTPPVQAHPPAAPTRPVVANSKTARTPTTGNPHCCNEPLNTLQPEAVNYRPM